MCWSQWPRRLRRRSAAARLLRLLVQILPGAWMFVCCECCVLSGRGLCDELIAHPEEYYWLWCVVCDLETSWMRRPWPAGGLLHQKKRRKKKIYHHMCHRRGGEKFYFQLTSHLCCNAGDMLTHTQIMDFFYLTLSHTITDFALECAAVVIKFTYLCILLYTKYLCILTYLLHGAESFLRS